MNRPEIIVEGSNDGQNWRAYDFRYKPGAVDRRPSWNIPYQPRLDWQMWFAAYGSFAQNPWFERMVRRLLEGSPPVVALLASNPFSDNPAEKCARASLWLPICRSRYTRENGKTGDWWVRREEGLYFPETSLN